MSSNLNKEIKQKYLREHIMEKGYDTEQFITYIQTLKG